MDVGIFTVRTDAHRDFDRPIDCEISPLERISSRSFPGQIKVSRAYRESGARGAGLALLDPIP
ncbi:MAG TPA: hypothetical protein VF396_06830 [Bradyrhizobium sp.]